MAAFGSFKITSAWPQWAQFGLQKKDIRPLGDALSAANHEPTFFGGLRTRFRGEKHPSPATTGSCTRRHSYSVGGWRPDRESNPGAGICSPLRHHSAIGPQDLDRFRLNWPETIKVQTIAQSLMRAIGGSARRFHLRRSGSAKRALAGRAAACQLGLSTNGGESCLAGKATHDKERLNGNCISVI